MKRYLSGRKADALEIASCVVIYATAILVSLYPALVVGLYNDNLTLFSLFRNNAYSLNYFGEPSWWLPHVNFGHAGFVSAVLYPSAYMSPAPVLTSAIVWLVGKLGMHIEDFRALYMIHAYIFLPSIFVVCAWLVARLFPNVLVRIAIFGSAAFAPVVIQNISDPGLIETAAYTLLCTYAAVKFMRQPSGRNLLIGMLAFSLLVHTLNLAFFYWGIPFLVLMGLAIFAPKSSRRIALDAMSARPAWQWYAALVVVGIGALPFLAAMLKLREFTKPGFAGGGYTLNSLVAGNPFQVLLASTPGVSFLWDHYRASVDSPVVQYFPHTLAPARAFGYGYLGLLAIPLATCGLIFGRAAMRWRLGLMGLVLFSTLLLAGFSPLYSAAAQFLPALRMNNHFSDLLYQSGGYLILSFLGILGLERILDGNRQAARLTLRVLLIWGLVSTGFLLYLYRGTPSQFGSLTGLYIFLQLCSAYLLWQMSRGGTRRSIFRFGGLLVFVLVTDIATAGFWHLRTVITPITSVPKRDVNDAVADNLDLVTPEATFAARVILVRKNDMDLLDKHIREFAQLPLLTVIPGNLALPHPSADVPVQNQLPRAGSAELLARTFNSLSASVTTRDGGQLFVADAWDPFWRAEVNGHRVEVARTLGMFKSIPVPPGVSRVELRYRPVTLEWMLGISYFVLALLFLMIVASNRRTRPNPEPIAP